MLHDEGIQLIKDWIASLEGELERAYGEQKQMQLDHHAKQTENARLRVEHGVRTRLLENNLQELSSHVEGLEQRLRGSGMDVPSLQLTPIDLPGLDEELPPKPEPAAASNPGHARKRGDILRFRTKR